MFCRKMQVGLCSEKCKPNPLEIIFTEHTFVVFGWLPHCITRVVGLDGELVGAVLPLAIFDALQSNTL